jgi:septal ring factor EnvC (AmiA/AmiB activator)
MAISSRRVALACVLIAFAAAPRPADVAWAEKRSLEDLRRVLDQQQKDAAERKAREESLRNQAESLKAEVAELRARMIETAGRIQDQESDASRLEKRLSNLEARERALRERLKANQDSAAKTLGALERLALSPPTAILARPAESAVQTVRTAVLLRALVPNIELEAAGLRKQIAALRISNWKPPACGSRSPPCAPCAARSTANARRWPRRTRTCSRSARS